jgi:hypothetical protein
VGIDPIGVVPYFSILSSCNSALIAEKKCRGIDIWAILAVLGRSGLLVPRALPLRSASGILKLIYFYLRRSVIIDILKWRSYGHLVLVKSAEPLTTLVQVGFSLK